MTGELMIDSELNLAIQKFVEVRDQRQELEEVVKKLKAKEELLEEELWIRMEAAQFSSIKTEQYGLIVRTFRSNPFIVDFLKFREWCEHSGNVHLIREEAKRQELRNFISAGLKESSADAIPPGVEYVTQKVIQIKGRRDSDEP
jgi:very-short-patch-repair endonuclease